MLKSNTKIISMEIGVSVNFKRIQTSTATEVYMSPIDLECPRSTELQLLNRTGLKRLNVYQVFELISDDPLFKEAVHKKGFYIADGLKVTDKNFEQRVIVGIPKNPIRKRGQPKTLKLIRS
jgi:hypothetical protein